MKNFNEFCEYVRDNIKGYLPEKMNVSNITLTEVLKNNDERLKAITVESVGNNASPNIYLEGFYNLYKDGEDIQHVMEEISDVIKQNPCGNVDVQSIIGSLTFVQDKIVFQLVNAERNKSLLADVPHRIQEDLAIVYRIILSTEEFGTASILVKNNLLDMWGVDEKVIFGYAEKNTPELLPAVVSPMTDVLTEIMARDFYKEEIDEEFNQFIDERMWVITNQQKVNGAGTILYNDILPNLQKRLGTKLYILPSSIHECLVVTEDLGTPEYLVEMVKEVNSTQVSATEQLSDHVYEYVDGKIVVAA